MSINSLLREARAIRIPKGRIMKLAKDIEKELHRKLKDDPTPLGSTGPLVTRQFPFTNAAGDYVEPHIIVRARPSRGATTYVLGGGIGKSKLVSGDVVIIDINGSMSSAVLKRGSVPSGGLMHKAVYDALIHELTHAAEPPRRSRKRGYKAGGSEIPTVGEIDPKAYYNDPREVRAYTQEIISEVAHFLKKWDTLRRVFKSSGEALRLTLKGSSTWGEIEPYLSTKNRRYIIKAVATAIRDR